MLENGKIIINRDGECIFGSNLKAKENISEIGMKVHGLMELETDMESFIMPTDLNTRDIGRITWSKDMLFIPIRMARYRLFCSRKTEWYVTIIQLQ